MLWPFGLFRPFWMLTKIVYFMACFWTNLNRFQAFYEILNSNFVILTIFLKENWPLFDLFHFSGFGLFETTYGQIWSCKFFEPGNPENNLPQMGAFAKKSQHRIRDRIRDNRSNRLSWLKWSFYLRNWKFKNLDSDREMSIIVIAIEKRIDGFSKWTCTFINAVKMHKQLSSVKENANLRNLSNFSKTVAFISNPTFWAK